MSIGAMLAERDFLYRKEQPPWGRPDNKTLSLTLEIPYVFKSIKYWFNMALDKHMDADLTKGTLGRNFQN